MGILGKFKDLVGIDDYEEEEEYEEIQYHHADARRQQYSRG